MDIFRILEQHPPFKVFCDKENEIFEDLFQYSLFFEGEYIFRQNDLPVKFGIIHSGTAEILFETSSNKRICIQSLRPGDLFGLFSISPQKKALYDIRCNEPMICYVQEPEDFWMMIETYPQIKEYIYDILMNRIWNIYDVIYKETGKVKDDISEKLRASHHFEKAIAYISKNYMEPLSLGDVAKVAGVSKYHFSRLFKIKTGCSFKEYLNLKRIEAAKMAIRTEDMNVTQVCFHVGYSDLSYFSRVFRKAEGVSPSSYSKRMKAKKHR